MTTIKLQFTRDYTQIIKGIAILFMMILHVGGSGATYDVPMRTMDAYPIIGFLHPSFKLCVGIFTFMIGYGYAFAKVKDWHYSIKHIWSLLKVFLMILLVITVPSILFVFRYRLVGQDFIILAMRELNLLLLTFCIFSLVTIGIQPKDGILPRLGNRYSLYIYIFHVLIMSVCEMFATKLPSNLCDLYMYIHPICVFLLSIALTSILGRLKILKVK